MDVLSTNVATTRVGGCVYARTCFFCVTKQRIHVVTPTVGSFVFFLCVGAAHELNSKNSLSQPRKS
jgi:hypothetical protein